MDSRGVLENVSPWSPEGSHAQSARASQTGFNAVKRPIHLYFVLLWEDTQRESLTENPSCLVPDGISLLPFPATSLL